jgi:methylmalonyl-CoA epimerase
VTLEHLGIAVRDAEEAVALFTALLGHVPYKEEVVGHEGVRTLFFGDGGAAGRAPKVELLAVTDPESPVAKFLDRRGPGLHHVAFRVDDLAASLERLRAAGFEPVTDRPAAGADGKRVAFLHPRSTGGVLVELCEAHPTFERVDVDVEGGSIPAFVAGPPSAPALLVLHGILGSSATQTDPLARLWAADYRVISVDLRGHGESTAGGALSIEGLSEDVAAVLDATRVARAHVFGYSLGAAVALYSAWRTPERLGRVALLGTNVRWSEDEARVVTSVMRTALDAPAGPWARSLAATHGEARWRALAESAIAFTGTLPSRPFPSEYLRAVGQPVLLIHGDRDSYFDVHHAVDLHGVLPDSRLWVVPGGDHPIRSVDVASLAAGVADFLRGDRPPAPDAGT